MTIKGDLSVSGIKSIQKQLKDYENQLMHKVEIFTLMLADLGIEVAENSVGNFGHHITFITKDFESSRDGCQVLVYATDISRIISIWKTKEGLKSAEVSPLLMAEFGSGKYAENPKGIEGVGRGTFPRQKNAWKDEGWYWQTLDGEWHHSSGIAPTQPMYKASIEILNQIDKVARYVFKE